MATENYGAFAQLVASVASTPVSTDTVIIFIGASASGELNEAKLITSMADYSTLLGGAPGDGYNLTEAAIAAFQIAGINKCYMIPVSNSTTFNAADYIGDADQYTGVHAVEKLFMNSPTAVNILCAPSITDGSVIAELMSVAKKANGHWDSFVMVDGVVSEDAITGSTFTDPDEITKIVSDEQAVQCLGRVKTSGGYDISLAAVRACLQALSDANYGVPARSGGNLYIPNMVSWGDKVHNPDQIPFTWGYTTNNYTITLTDVTGNGSVYIKGSIVTGYSGTGPVYTDIDGVFEYTAGVIVITLETDPGSSIADMKISIHENVIGYYPIILSESLATQLSSDGICSVINYGGGLWHTWGDHTSAFFGGTVSDERARFDNTIRMNIMITNRFQLKYRFEIDNPMTLQMRNDVINEELDYLNSLVAIGGLIGEPSVEFRAADNGSDQVSQGYFTWTTQDTPTIPAKYMLNKVAYTQAGLSVYTQNA